MAPVSLVYQGRLYVAARYAASLAHLGISWSQKRQMVTLGGASLASTMSAMARATPFAGPVAVQVRHVRLVVRGREWTPAGRALQIGGQRLPDATLAPGIEATMDVEWARSDRSWLKR